MTRVFLMVLCCAAVALRAEEKKEEKKKEPPRVTALIPLGLVPGETNALRVRGLNLTNATEIRFDSKSGVTVVIGSREKTKVPDKQDVKKVGDTQLDLQLHLPADALPESTTFVVVGPDGESEPRRLLFLKKETTIAEKEPNGSFREAQRIQFGQTVQGLIQEPNDVDVFAFEAAAPEKIAVEIQADSLGSPMDSILTLYDSQRHIVATSDDSGSSHDSRLAVNLAAAGAYLISVIDAHDQGGPAHAYLLTLRHAD